MTLTQLEYTYNFHDSDVFTPFETNGDSIIVVFNLAKHLQYDELKSRYGNSLNNKANNLIVKVKFSNCLDLQVSEWNHCTSNTKNQKKQNERTITIEDFDADSDFISLSISEEDKISFRFEKLEKNGKLIKLSEIKFVCQNIEILEESLLDSFEYDKVLSAHS